jgi:hypothetical protein
MDVATLVILCWGGGGICVIADEFICVYFDAMIFNDIKFNDHENIKNEN